MEPTLEHTVSFLSLIYIGAIPVSVKPSFGDKDEYIEYLIKLGEQNNIKYFHIDINPDSIKFESFKSNLDAKGCNYERTNSSDYNNDIAFIQFSSGSTSEPKAIPIKHKNIHHNINMITKVDNRSRNTIGLNFLPLSHDMGLIGGLLSNIIYQNTFYLTSIDLFLRKISFYLNLCYEEKISITGMPNFVYEYLTKRLSSVKNVNPKLLSGIKTIYSGAEPIRITTIKNFLNIAKKFGLSQESLVFSYGLAETTLIVSSHRFINYNKSFMINMAGEHVACVGKPVENTEVLIDKEDSKVGKILVAGDSVVDDVDTVLFNGKKYLYTGDLGYIYNHDLYVSGREKDMVIINGNNIFLVDVENYIYRKVGQEIEGLIVVVIPCQEAFGICLSSRKNIAKDILNNVEKIIIQGFNIKAKYVLYVLPKNIPRTTSGKVQKMILEKNIRDKYEQYSYC